MAKTYLEQRREMKLKAPHGSKEKASARTQDKQEKALWFGAQALQAPSKCENCGTSLQATINFHPRAHICHIVPKMKEGGCPSVATHPLNRWFGCTTCHDGYDRMMAEKDYHEVVQMRVWPVIVERFRQVFPFISEPEQRRIPTVLTNAITE